MIETYFDTLAALTLEAPHNEAALPETADSLGLARTT